MLRSSSKFHSMTALHDTTTATVLAHVVLRWEAEFENARRLSNRENGT